MVMMMQRDRGERMVRRGSDDRLMLLPASFDQDDDADTDSDFDADSDDAAGFF